MESMNDDSLRHLDSFGRKAKGVELDIVSTNACITVLGQHVAWVCWRKALQLLAQLEDQTLEKRIVTVNALINACEKSRLESDSEKIVEGSRFI